MTGIRKQENNGCWQSCGETGNLVHCWWGCEWVQLLSRVWLFLENLNSEVPYGPAITLFRDPKAETQRENVYGYVHGSAIHNTYDVEPTQVSTQG